MYESFESREEFVQSGIAEKNEKLLRIDIWKGFFDRPLSSDEQQLLTRMKGAEQVKIHLAETRGRIGLTIYCSLTSFAKGDLFQKEMRQSVTLSLQRDMAALINSLSDVQRDIFAKILQKDLSFQTENGEWIAGDPDCKTFVERLADAIRKGRTPPSCIASPDLQSMPIFDEHVIQESDPSIKNLLLAFRTTAPGTDFAFLKMFVNGHLQIRPVLNDPPFSSSLEILRERETLHRHDTLTGKDSWTIKAISQKACDLLNAQDEDKRRYLAHRIRLFPPDDIDNKNHCRNLSLALQRLALAVEHGELTPIKDESNDDENGGGGVLVPVAPRIL